MKKRIISLILTFALLLSVLIGCNSETEPTATTDNSGGTTAQTAGLTPDGEQTPEIDPNTKETNEPSAEDTNDPSKDEPAALPEPVEAEPAWTEPDYSGFVMPEATGELIVYGMSGYDLALTAAVDLFREKYPDVRVRYDMLSEDEFASRIQAEIPAGHGPDLLFTFTSVIPDPFKSMSSHIFTDLNPYFLNDAEFDWNDYLKEAADCLLYQGERQIVPVELNLSVYKTSYETLTEAGINPEEIKTFEDYCAACIRYHEACPDNALYSSGGEDDYLKELLSASGMKFIDYNRGTASVNEEQLHALLDVCKAFHTGSNHEIDADHKAIEGLFERMYLCSNIGTGELSLMNAIAFIKNRGETPCLLPVTDIYGGVTAEVVSFAAVPQGSVNKLNAYRLLKILLSEEIQGGHEPRMGQRDYLQIGIPVSKPAIKKRTLAVKEMFFPSADENAQLIIDYCTSVTNASLLPTNIYRYIVNDMSGYIEGNKSWEDCYKKFLNTLELYASE